ncbi:Oidioi.mRNA.OKI2018_I69.chr2.g6482.t1.cds [Oikopleura dioica]|uniref:Oidioi.mRNA.OKI2018_I69.chr2.g6482.t1.cds n=1 Tax=Oikopleura dioica TaxID=34765 RepID=A0ABN7TA45_OIKDI|nr:Oidioi.mRNA.OKI2018_I69.chr2.g6482.t1.cds [Oikopleura dioica]
MVILTLIDDEGEECCGYEVRNCSQKGRGVFATKEYAPGDVIFDEMPAVMAPRDREVSCFHCAKPLESINQAASRLQRKRIKIFEIIPMNETPDVIEDQATELKFCSTKCFKEANDNYLNALRGKWKEYKSIENWIRVNKGPPHDQATLLAITKMMCMKQQKSKLVEDFEDMTSDRPLPNIEKFTKAVHTRFKSQNVFLENSHYDLLKYAEICGANFQLGTTSAIAPWIKRLKDIKCLERIQHAKLLKDFKDFDARAKKKYQEYLRNTGAQPTQSAAPHIASEFRALYAMHSKINHSCSPNVKVKMLENSSKVAIIALTPISLEDELCHGLKLIEKALSLS